MNQLAVTPTSVPRSRARFVRPVLVVALLVALWAATKMSGLLDRFDAAEVRTLVAGWGAWGVVGFVGLFALGELAHVPGMIFVAAAILAWGELAGFAIGFVGAVVSVCASFLLVRAVGGRALAEVERPFIRRLLTHLDRRPIRSVAILRLVFWLAPPVNYALAMTNIRFREYVIGSALGLCPPIAAAALLFDLLFRELT